MACHCLVDGLVELILADEIFEVQLSVICTQKEHPRDKELIVAIVIFESLCCLRSIAAINKDLASWLVK
jgi:hypothetical protein